MSIRSVAVAMALSAAAIAAPVQANDLEGYIESIDASSQSFVVQGIRFYVYERTDYDDGLRRFEDLQVGQKVEVDFEYREGRHWAVEIELED